MDLSNLDGTTKSLNLSRSSITDADLVRLAGLTALKMLYLGGASITDAGPIYYGDRDLIGAKK